MLFFPLNLTLPILATKHIKKADYQRAKNEYNEALKNKPDNSKINYNLGNVFKEEEYDKAIMAYNEALPKLSKQKQVSAYYNLGTAHLQKKDVKSAIEAYKEVLKLDPNHVKTRQNIELALRQQNQSSQSLSNDKMNEDTDEQEKRSRFFNKCSK